MTWFLLTSRILEGEGCRVAVKLDSDDKQQEMFFELAGDPLMGMLSSFPGYSERNGRYVRHRDITPTLRRAMLDSTGGDEQDVEVWREVPKDYEPADGEQLVFSKDWADVFFGRLDEAKLGKARQAHQAGENVFLCRDGQVRSGRHLTRDDAVAVLQPY